MHGVIITFEKQYFVIYTLKIVQCLSILTLILFSRLWPWIQGVVSSFLCLYQYLSEIPQTVCFAAFKEDQEPSLPLRKVTLLCVANHDKQNQIKKMKGKTKCQQTINNTD